MCATIESFILRGRSSGSLCFIVQWIYFRGMDFAANCVEHHVLVFGHSYVRRIGAFCCACGLVNLGLPSLYHIQLVGIFGATSQALELWAASIVNFKLELIIVDLGGKELAHSTCSVNELAAELLLHCGMLVYISDISAAGFRALCSTIHSTVSGFGISIWQR